MFTNASSFFHWNTAVLIGHDSSGLMYIHADIIGPMMVVELTKPWKVAICVQLPFDGGVSTRTKKKISSKSTKSYFNTQKTKISFPFISNINYF